MTVLVEGKVSTWVGKGAVFLIGDTSLLLKNKLGTFWTGYTEVKRENGLVFRASLALCFTNVVEVVLLATLAGQGIKFPEVRRVTLETFFAVIVWFF